MEVGFFSEGFWACVGALIGAIVGGVSTYIISRQTRKTELQKQTLEYLIFLQGELQSRLIEIEKIIALYNPDLFSRNDQVPALIEFIRRNKCFLSHEQLLKVEVMERKVEEKLKSGNTYDMVIGDLRPILELFQKGFSKRSVEVISKIDKLLNI